MKTQLHILVPTSTALHGVNDAVNALIAQHRLKDEDSIQPNWRFDYLCRFDATLNCGETDAELPGDLHSDLSGYISRTDRLRPDVAAGAVVTPDGEWYDCDQFGFRMMNDAAINDTAIEEWTKFYWQIMRENPDCWVIETWAHS